MKNKKIILLILSLIIIISIITIVLMCINKNKIPDGYIAVFHGGSGEVTYETYIYKIDNGNENYGFKYINVTRITKTYGSSKSNVKVTEQGTVDWTDNVFGVAEKNNANSYVTLLGSDKIYKIEEYMHMFLMN